MQALLPIIAAIIAGLQAFLPQIPQLLTLVQNIAHLIGQTTPITAEQEAQFWANLGAAHAALQAAGGPLQNVLAPAVAVSPEQPAA